MSNLLGVIISRSWPVWLLVWLALLIGLQQTAPAWNDVIEDREFSFLPEEAPTRQGQTLLHEAFPEATEASTAVIIFCRQDAELREEDRAFIKAVVMPALAKINEKDARQPEPLIAAIHNLFEPGTGDLFVSPDRQATLVVLSLTSEMLEHRNWPLIAAIEEAMANWKSHGDVPTGLELHLYGSAAVGRDLIAAQQTSTSATELWTIVAVVVILVLIYRAPLLALIPLLSVYMATQISLKLLTYLAQRSAVTLFDGIEVFITVILYGTGVDYCLFLIARYREEWEQGADSKNALARTVGKVGPALIASAATVMFGIGMMAFARFGKLHDAGIAVTFSLGVGLCVVLTFTTALISTAGRWVFWPHMPTPLTTSPRAPAGGFFWEIVGRALQRRPGLIWLGAILMLSPLVGAGILYGNNVDYNFVRRLPAAAPSSEGDRALRKHFPAGMAGTVTVLLHHPRLDFLATDSVGQFEIGVLTDRIRKEQARLQLADIRSWARPLGFTPAARKATGAPLEQINKGLKEATKYYISHAGAWKGHVTRLELTMLLDPMSREGMALLDDIEATIHKELPYELRGAKIYLLGLTADMRDIRAITQADQLRIQILVVVSVVVILFLLLRRPLVSVYLILSVLFSYFATLGATWLLFWWWSAGDFAGLDWKTPLFLFTILMAIGQDYNIFLLSRVGEEQGRHGPVEGVHVALVHTGRTITTCGLIMAGTFASLLMGSIQDLQHLGLALTIGVLMDTFIVRPILVPTFLISLERTRIFWRTLSKLVDAQIKSETNLS